MSQTVTRDAELIDRGRDPGRLRQYLHSLCLNTAGITEFKTLHEATGIDRKTAIAYDHLLNNLLVTDSIPAWWTNRLKRLIKAPKRYVIDPGIVGTVLRLTSLGLRKDGDLLGRLLDTYVMSQLRAELPVCEYEPSLYHLRTEQGIHEVDIVVEYGGDEVFGFEVKASGAPNSQDAKHLTWMRDELGDRFLGGAVLHTGPHSYPLGDRIIAAPICSLWG